MGELRYGQYYGGERERSYRATNFDYYDPMQAEGIYEMPIVRKTDTVPERLLGFNYAKCEKEDTQCGIHFFIDDYQTTMHLARKMLAEGIITEAEYRRIDKIFLEKYKPLFGALFSDILLTSGA